MLTGQLPIPESFYDHPPRTGLSLLQERDIKQAISRRGMPGVNSLNFMMLQFQLHSQQKRLVLCFQYFLHYVRGRHHLVPASHLKVASYLRFFVYYVLTFCHLRGKT